MAALSSSLYSPYNSIPRSSKKGFTITNAAIKPTKINAPRPDDLSIHFKKATDESTAAINDGGMPISAAATAKLYVVLEAVADRIEMHENIGEQRNNWNSLLLSSINMMTLTATTMAALTAGAAAHAQPLRLSSAALFAGATALLAVVNKLQPSQLVEEQRQATRLLKQLHGEIQAALVLRGGGAEVDVAESMARVLALDRAYPLPLIGVMLEKFPAELEAAVWWPPLKTNSKTDDRLETSDETRRSGNGWSDEIEEEMREIVGVLREKDKKDYLKLGNRALKLNKILSVLGPVFSGAAAVGSALSGSSSSLGALAMAAAVGGGALATVVNSIEHGGQVGMVVEMYRNCAGDFKKMEESIESAIGEEEVDRRENGELMEMKVSLQLGRSLSEMKDLVSSRRRRTAIDEFASKLL